MTNSLDPVLRSEHLTRALPDKAHPKILIDNLSVSLGRGETVAVVGPSGAGKSSFLRLLNRLDEPTGGTVYLNGIDYTTLPPRDLRRQVGMVMQAPYLFPGTVAANLRFGPEQRGETLPEEVLHDLLERVHLPGYAERDVARLSGGEAQRVSLARTLANKPGVLLLDEPTSALDEASASSVETLVCEIIREQTLGCFFVTHNIAQARRVADRVMVLDGGKLARIGTVAEMLDREVADAQPLV